MPMQRGPDEGVSFGPWGCVSSYPVFLTERRALPPRGHGALVAGQG